MSSHHSFFLRIFGTLLPLEQSSTLLLGIPYLATTRVFIPNLFFIVCLFQPLPKLDWLLRVHIDDSLFLPFPLLNFPWIFRARDSMLLVRLLCGTWIALLRCWLRYSFLISKSMSQPARLFDGCSCVVL